MTKASNKVSHQYKISTSEKALRRDPVENLKAWLLRCLGLAVFFNSTFVSAACPNQSGSFTCLPSKFHKEPFPMVVRQRFDEGGVVHQDYYYNNEDVVGSTFSASESGQINYRPDGTPWFMVKCEGEMINFYRLNGTKPFGGERITEYGDYVTVEYKANGEREDVQICVRASN